MAEDTEDLGKGPLLNPENPDDIRDFIPSKLDQEYPEFGGMAKQFYAPAIDNARNNFYPIQDDSTGFPPFKPGKVNPEGDGVSARGKRTKAMLVGLQDNNTYAKMHTYDASPAGAFKQRYKGYSQSTYDKIGFNPDVNNEALFNSKTSVMDDMQRMVVHAALPLLGYGLISGPKSYIQAAQGNFGQDTDEADFYEEYAAIGNSTKGGFWGFTNNVVNSLAYTAGIMTEGAIEGALMSRAIGAAGGPVGVGAGAIGGGLEALLTKAGKLPSMIKNWKASGQSILGKLSEFQDINKARQLFTAAGKTVGDFINPFDNTFRAVDRYVLNNVDNLDDMARAARTFGGFYFDLRNANMALSEARLEGGFNENESYKELYDDYYNRTGESPSADLQKQFRDTARQSGWQTTWENALLINYTNRLVMPNIMRGATNRLMPGATELIKEFGPVDLVHSAKKGFEIAEVSLKNAGKALLKPATYGKAGLGYFKANIMEGTQEVLQDVISEHTRKYYVDSFYNPNRRNWDYSMGILKNAIKKQLSAEGFETFASGFVMGGAFTALDKAYKHLSVGYNQYYKNRDNYDDYFKERQQSAEELRDELNTHYKDPIQFFNSRLFNYGAQGSIARVHDDEETTTKEDIDSKEASLKSALITMFQTGTDKYFVDHIKSFQYMTPAEVEDAMKLKKGDGEKAIQRIDGILSKLKSMKNTYEFMSDKMGTPIDPNNFEKDTDEYKQAAIFKSAWNTAKFNAVFLAESFKENLTRQNKLSGSLDSITQFKDLPVNAITPLLNLNTLDDELKMLKEEIESLKGSTDPMTSKLRLKKQKQLDGLENFGKKLESWYNHFISKKAITKEIEKIKKEKGVSDEEAAKQAFEVVGAELANVGNSVKSELKEAFVKYLTDISGGTVDFLAMMSEAQDKGTIKSLDDAFERLTDYHKLEHENSFLTEYVNLLTDPAGFAEHVKRNFQWMSDMYDNRTDFVKDTINKAFEAKENDDLLKDLADQGIYLDLDEFAEWVQDNKKLPSYFIDETSKKIIPQGSALYEEVLEKFQLAARLHSVKAAGEKSTLEEKLKHELEENEDNRNKAKEKARKTFDRNIKKETGKTEQELRDLERKAMAATSTVSAEKEIKDLNSLKNKVEKADAEEREAIDELLEQYKVITKEELVEARRVFQEDTEKITATILPIIKERVKKEPDVDPLEIINAETTKYIVLPLLEEKLSKLESAEETPADFVRVEETEAWGTYQNELKDIDTKYDGIANDIKAKYINKGAELEEEKPSVIPTTATKYDELPEDLKAILDPLFAKYLENVGEVSPDRIDEIRQNWLEQQSAIIDKYNKDAETFDEEKEIRFKFLPNKFPGGLAVTDLALSELVDFRKYLETELSEKKHTPEDKGKISADIKTLDKYIAFRRSNFDLEAKFEDALNTFKTKVLDRQAEVTEIKDDEGNVVSRRIDDKTPQRATKQAEQIQLDLIPESKPFIFGIVEEKIDKEGNVTQGEAVKIFREILNNDKIPTENKVGQFMTLFAAKFAQPTRYQRQFENEGKVNKLREALEKSFTEEILIETVNKLAFEESAIAGNTIDVLTRKFFTLNETKTGFEQVTKPANMSDQAFESLFGPRGVITEFRDKMIDGEFFIISNDVNVFDMDLLESGLAGAIDLLAINSEGDFEIIDIKTGSEDNWKKFDKEFLYKVKEGDTVESIAKDRKTTVEKIEDLNDFKKYPLTPGKMIYVNTKSYSKKLYYRLQQSIYRVLFNNMTGIMPTRLGLLPLQVELTLNGYIKSAKKASIVPKGKSTVTLDYVPEIEEYGVVPKKPGAPAAPATETETEQKTPAKRGRKPSGKQVQSRAKKVINPDIQEVPGVRTDVENRTDEYISKIENAKTPEEVMEHKGEAHIAYTKEPLSVDIDIISKIAASKLEELKTSTTVSNVKVGETIISKVPIFEDEAGTPFKVKVITDNKIEIESTLSGDTIQINPEELETKFGKMSEETFSEKPSELDEMDLENAVRSGENVDQLLADTEELNNAVTEVKDEGKKSVRGKLKENSKKC